MDILNNKYVKLVIIIVVVLVVLWLGCIILDKIGGHAHIGAGVGTSGFDVNIGGVKS